MSFYNVLAFLCRNSQDAARAAARFGNGEGIGRFFIFLGKAPTLEETSWMTPEDTKIVLERVIEHPEAEQIAVRATFMYSGAHAWNIVFCWAENFPEFQSISQTASKFVIESSSFI
jgi:hypothetical protein